MLGGCSCCHDLTIALGPLPLALPHDPATHLATQLMKDQSIIKGSTTVLHGPV